MADLSVVPLTSKKWSDESAVLVSLKIGLSMASFVLASLNSTSKGPQYAFELKTAISSMFHAKLVAVPSIISSLVSSGNGSGSTINISEI